MATTHGFVGVLLAAAVSLLAPEHAATVAAAGLLGGLAPDLDLYAGHRRTLHFPVYGVFVALVALSVAVVWPTALVLSGAAFLLAAAAHAAMDVLGGGLELRPWEATSDRAVYSHYHGRWLSPRRWVAYDGAPRDLGFAVALGFAALTVSSGVVAGAVTLGLIVSTGYTLSRKRLATVASALAGLLPPTVAPYVPERYR